MSTLFEPLRKVEILHLQLEAPFPASFKYLRFESNVNIQLIDPPPFLYKRLKLAIDITIYIDIQTEALLSGRKTNNFYCLNLILFCYVSNGAL